MRIDSVKFSPLKTRGGGETVKVVLRTSVGSFSAAPAFGTSAGVFEVKSFGNKGLSDCVKNFPDLSKLEVDNLEGLDSYLHMFDKEPYGLIGGNLVLGVEVAFMRALAKQKGKELFEVLKVGKKIPKQLGKVVGGGLHSSSKGPVFQEFLISTNREDDLGVNREIHSIVGKLLKSKKLDLEGGWQTDWLEEDILTVLRDLLDDDFPKTRLGLDIAANSFLKGNKYVYRDKKLSTGEHLDYVKRLIKDYKLFYVEDPFVETDFKSFSRLQKQSKTLVCGDDLTVTSIKRLKMALKQGSMRAGIVKPNQIGSLLSTINYVKELKKNKIKSVVSHRSKETMDDFLADLAIGSDLFKIGIKGKERVIKLKRLSVISKK